MYKKLPIEIHYEKFACLNGEEERGIVTKKYVIKDSGKRVTFKSGAVRDVTEGKIRWDLLPVEALKRVAQHYTTGAKKYTDNNWKKGIPTGRFIEGVCRHWAQYRMSLTEVGRNDPEYVDEDHLSAVIFNVLGIIYNEETAKIPKTPETHSKGSK